MNYGTNSRSLIFDYLGVLKGGGGYKKIFEKVMAKKFPNLIKTINLQNQESQGQKLQRKLQRHIIINLLRTKNLQSNYVTYKGTKIKMTTDFSVEVI